MGVLGPVQTPGSLGHGQQLLLPPPLSPFQFQATFSAAPQEAKAAFAEPHHSSLGIWAGPWLASVPLSSQVGP